MTERGPPLHDEEPVANPFEHSHIDRRTFLSVAAATGASLSLPGAVSAQDRIESDLLTDLATFVVNHTPVAYETGLVVEFESADAAATFDDTFSEETDSDRVRPEKTVIRESPTPAGHGLLTGPEVEDLLELSGIERVEFSPGSNPFWRLDDGPYENGVFSDVEDARDYLSFEETVAGLEHLESNHADRLNVTTLGRESPGWNNLFLDEQDRYPIYVAELTNDIDDEAAFEEKEKVSYVLSIHGDEPQGREAGTRVIEDVLTGDAEQFAELLDDVVLVFAYVNPDGWISREPFTELPYDVQFDDVNFLRGNGSFEEGSQLDTNRQYPTIGWTNPGFHPAEPNGAPDFFEDLVPDALAVVEHFREYENVGFLCDYHGMGVADQMVFNLETNAAFDHKKTHDLDEVSVQIGEGMVDEWGSIDTISDDIAAALEEHYPQINNGDQYLPTGDSYEGFLDWGTIFDTIGYQVTGGLIGWAGAPEEDGGLGAITVAAEMFHSNPFRLTYMNWKPYWARHQVTSYRTSMREYARLGAAETDATVVTGGTDTAYVRSDELTRSSADLSHTGGDSDAQENTATTQRRTEARTLTARRGVSRTQIQTNTATHSLSVQFDGHPTGELRLRNPRGDVVRRLSLDEMPTAGPESLFVSDPAAGEWTLELDGDGRLDVSLTMLEVTAESPDPRQAWDGEGFEQREYEVNPMQFFEDLAPYIDDSGTLDGISVDDVRSGLEEYDQLVLSHDAALDDDEFVTAISTFVENGGDLVVTDTGVHLLGKLDIGTLSNIQPADIRDILVRFASLRDRDTGHVLLTDIRDRQQEIWKGPQVGYTASTDQPATVIDPDAFRIGGGEAAGILGAEPENADAGTAAIGEPGVGAGSLTVGDADIQVIGSILPPANQSRLHPFGMADYSLSFMGHTMLCNALGYVQQRLRDGSVVRTYGPSPPAIVGNIPPRDLDGDGNYEDLNGDGELTLTDVQTLFSRRDDPVVQENAALFNFSGNDPEQVTTEDVQALFSAYLDQ